MTPTISADQRNLLYDHMLNRLSGIADVWLAVKQEDYGAARRLGVAISDDLRLITEDLGWGEKAPSETIALRTPPDVVRRALRRMRAEALKVDAREEEKRAELRENGEANQLLAEACRQVLASLEGELEDETDPKPSPWFTKFPLPRGSPINIRLGRRRK
jgi:hypothetical protein